MRTFLKAESSSVRFVTIKSSDHRLVITRGTGQSVSDRKVTTLASAEAVARACETLTSELVRRGYVERIAAHAPRDAARPRPVPTSTALAETEADVDSYGLLEGLKDSSTAETEEVFVHAPLPRMAHPRPGPVVTATPTESADDERDDEDWPTRRRRRGRRKSKTKAKTDWIFIGGMSGLGLGVLVMAAVILAQILSPPTIVGTWRGGNLKTHMGAYFEFQHLRMTLNEHGQAMLDHSATYRTLGTYVYDAESGLLELTLVGEDGADMDTTYQVELGKQELILRNPNNKEILFEMMRERRTLLVPMKPPPTEVAAPKEAEEPTTIDWATMPPPNRAPVTFEAKDHSFRCRYPEGYESKGGARPDNTFAWAEFERDRWTVRVEAGVFGSLMIGPDIPSAEEVGESRLAKAHRQARLKVGEELGEFFDESTMEVTILGLGTGRISELTIPKQAMFGTKQRGIRATFLTLDRRIILVGTCPEEDWPAASADFVAILHSLAR